MTSRARLLTFWTQDMDLQIKLLKAKILDQTVTRAVHRRLALISKSKAQGNTTIAPTMAKLWLRFLQFMPRDRGQYLINLVRQISRCTTKVTIQIEIIAQTTISWALTQITLTTTMVEGLWATLEIWTVIIITITSKAQELVDLVTVSVLSLERQIFLTIIQIRTILLQIIIKEVCHSRIPQIIKLMEV